MRQRTTPRPGPISYSGAAKRRSTNGRPSSTTARSVSVYVTRMRPSVTRERYFQYVRARRSRCVAFQRASSSAAGTVTSAAWIERTAPRSSMTVCSSGSRMTAFAAWRSRRAWRSPLMSAERCPHRLVEAERVVVEPRRRRLLDHHLALEAVDEGAHEARLDRGDERDPV